METAGLIGRLRDLFGVDRAVGFSLFNRAWGFVTGPVTIYLITRYFSPDLQGYHYTFSSFLLLQSMLELGFGVVLTQFISHEWAKLRHDTAGAISGDSKALARLNSLVRLGLKWYLAVAVLFLFVIGGCGLLFFGTQQTTVPEYNIAWGILCVMVSLSIFGMAFRSFLEGSNQVGFVQSMSFVGAIVSTLAGWTAIYFGAGIYSICVMVGTSAVFNVVSMLPRCTPFLRLRVSQNDVQLGSISWLEEFWPQQWRIGLSWLSGFLMFQAFVPVMFYFHGPVAAGKLGASMRLYDIVNSVGLSWANAIGPTMGILGARRDYAGLRDLVRKTLKRSFVATSLAALAMWAIMRTLNAYGVPQALRFTDMVSISLLMITAVIMQLSHVETLAIRFQKIEPFVRIAVVSAVLVLLSNVFLGSRYGVMGFVGGFAFTMAFILVPVIHRIYGREITRFQASVTS